MVADVRRRLSGKSWTRGAVGRRFEAHQRAPGMATAAQAPKTSGPLFVATALRHPFELNSLFQPMHCFYLI